MATVYQTRYDRLRKLIEREGGNKSAVAARIGITRQYMQAVASDKPTKSIGDILARRIEKVYQLQEGYMDAMILNSVETVDGFVEIPLLDVRGSMGPGLFQPEEGQVIQLIRLSKEWIREHVRGVSIKNLAIITGKGDSMSPTITDGALILVDTGRNVIDVDGVYVIARSGELFIKRMQRLLNGGYRIISDNERYPAQELSQFDLDQVDILGRAVVSWSPTIL